MRRALLALLVALPLLVGRTDLQSALLTSAHLQAAPLQSAAQAPVDPVPWFLAEFESALSAGDAALARLVAPEPPTLAASLRQDIRGADGAGVRVVFRERERRASGNGVIVTTDVLVSRDRTGRVATYDFTLRPRPAGGALELTFFRRVAYLDGLHRLSLDTAKQFDVRNLEFVAPDLVLKMPSGVAFTASTEDGTTALVLHGRGELHFTPREEAEQDQLRIFARRPSLDVTVEDAFIRVHPSDLGAHMSAGSLVPAKLTSDDAERAQGLFDRFLPRSYSLTLGDLSPDRWSILPPAGNLALEFKSARYGWLTYARSMSDPEDITLFDRDRGKNISLYTSAEKIERRGRFYDEDTGASFDVLHYDVDVKFDPARALVSGRGRLRLRVLSEATQTFSLRLAESLLVSSVISPELGRLLPLRVAGQTTMLLSLPTTVRRGQEFTIEIAYAGRLESQDLGNEIVLPDRSGRPVDAPEAIQQPEPRFMYSNRSYWHPQALTNDYATASLRLTVPAEYQMMATGIETSSTLSTSEGRSFRTVEFVTDRPVRYLACQISRFAPIGRASGGGVDVDILATPRQVNANRNVAPRAVDVIKFYADQFGAPPYPKLTIGFIDSLLPAGHSPAYYALIQQPLPSTPYTWRQDPLAFDAYPELLMAHEIAHQWWGQAVGFKNYHDQWLSEGLAHYSAAMFIANDRPDLERALIQKMRDSAQSLSPQGPVYLGYRLGHIEGRSAAFRGVVYNKAAVVLHMLRRFVGDEAFHRGLRRFYREWQFQKAGTDDLRAAFEAESGRPLGRYFDRWILGSTLPQLRVRSSVDVAGAFASVQIDQLGQVFDMPFTITLQYVDGRSRDVTLQLADPSTRHRIPLDGKLKRIVTRDELTLAEYVN